MIQIRSGFDPEQAHNALLRKMDGGGDEGDFDVGALWSDGEGDEVGPRPTHDGGMDTMSMEQLGLKAQDVPADGNCLLHAFAQAQRRTSHAAKATPTQVLREQLAELVESRKEAIGRLHEQTGVCPWSRLNWHGEIPPTTIEEYTQFLRKDGTWLGTYELNLLATELGPTEKVFTRDMRSGKWSLITRLDTSSKVIPHSHSLCKHDIDFNRDRCLGFEGAHFVPLFECAPNGTHGRMKDMYATAQKAQDKQAMMMQRLSAQSLNPIKLPIGMIVKVEGEGKCYQTNHVSKVDPICLYCVVHSEVHQDVYQLVGPSGFLQTPRARQLLEPKSDEQGKFVFITNYVRDDGLQTAWAACKDHQPGEKGFKTVPAGPMVRDRHMHDESNPENTRAQTLEAFAKCWQARMHVEAKPVRKRKDGDDTTEIFIPRPNRLLTDTEYNTIVAVLRMKESATSIANRGDRCEYINTETKRIYNLKTVEKKDTQKVTRINKAYALERGVEGEKVQLKRKTTVDSRTMWCYALSESMLPDVLYELHRSGFENNAGCHTAATMVAAAEAKYTSGSVNEEVCRAFKKCCVLCNGNLHKRVKKAHPGFAPIRSTYPFERVQIDLIIMTSVLPSKNEGKLYILTVKDHFSGFVWLRALKRKNKIAVFKKLKKIFRDFRTPDILQADNGGEFKNLAMSTKQLRAYCKRHGLDLPKDVGDETLESRFASLFDEEFSTDDLAQCFPNTHMVHSRVRASSTNGSVERANQDVQRMLYYAMLRHGVERREDQGVWIIHLDKVCSWYHGHSHLQY